MRIIIILLFSIPFILSAQTKTTQEWKNNADNWFNETSVSSGPFSPGKEVYDAALKSHSTTDMYFESTGSLWGCYRLWQASGDFNYLDKAFDLVEADIDNSKQLDIFYEKVLADGANNLGMYWMNPMPYKGFVQLPNYYMETYNYTYPSDRDFSYWFPNKKDYLDNANDNKYSYNYVAGSSPEHIYSCTPLNENIYFRFAADMLRVIHNNPSVLSKTSGNGQLYQKRYNKVLDFIEKHIWEKWVEYESYNNHKRDYVYRENTHMSSHLASIALSLFVVTDKQKYADFVNEFLYDFGSDPQSTNILPGVGFLNQIEDDSNGAKVWSSSWGKSVLDNRENAQDIAHAGPELAFLVQCFQEGFGGIDQKYINGLVNMFKNNVIIGSPCSSKTVSFKIDSKQEVHSKKGQLGHGFHVLTQFDPELLCFLENNISNGDMRLGYYAHGAYAASILNGYGPVYPSSVDVSNRTNINNIPLKISQNPALSGSEISISGFEIGSSYNLSIYNISRVLVSNSLIEQANTKSIEHNLPSLPSGIYILTLKSMDKKYKGKLVIK